MPNRGMGAKNTARCTCNCIYNLRANSVYNTSSVKSHIACVFGVNID